MSNIYFIHVQIHQLEALIAIVEVGSFTLAAERLGVSQSALSHAVAALERELGVVVLERGRQGSRPTEVGEKLLPHAREVLARLERIRAEARGAAHLVTGRVRIGSIPSATVDFLPRLLAAFGRQFPNVELVLLEEPSQGTGRLLEWLGSHTIDLALLELPVTEFETVPLLHDELCAVVPATSYLAGRVEVRVRELVGETFVLSRYSSEHLIEAAYRHEGLTPNVRFEVQDLGTLVSLIREGLGISLVPRLALPRAPEGVALLSVSPRPVRQLGFVVRSLAEASPAVQALIKEAKSLTSGDLKHLS
ncbi:LysR family transcriptional regulator [Deinococcus hopiensis]|uniref:DNA-binding transcriptional regulator, LysR family n=1 Tax=Deinococcus hopiensis KR-140 TaxID=695939 RepID=A0A1W1UNS7_9DEIO|nr:LysR family transcriptional regulator [Deinococcus hopiensis]SMB82775.1 DNA-binding transcriptional regulator, LysR family [Deinococcus hopiensis KR-140]